MKRLLLWESGWKRRAETSALLGLACLGLGVLFSAAIGRQLCFQAGSPVDLAFFHQSTWSAAHGFGFAQNTLHFEGSELLKCVHLSLIRLAMVLLYQGWPSLLSLVSFQALAVGLGLIPLWHIARKGTGSGWAAALFALACWVHPLTTDLATTDFRPIVFLVPSLAWVIWGIDRRSTNAVLLGSALALTAREEAPLLLLALTPFAVFQGLSQSGSPRSGGGCSREPPLPRTPSSHGSRLPSSMTAGPPQMRSGRRWAHFSPSRLLTALSIPTILLAFAGLGFVGLELVWGHWSNLSASGDIGLTVHAILIGERPLFRDALEVDYAFQSILPLSTAFLVPELMIPALAGWGFLTVFSRFESVSAGGLGVHYLAVVYPFLMGASAVGFVRMLRGIRRLTAKTSSTVCPDPKKTESIPQQPNDEAPPDGMAPREDGARQGDGAPMNGVAPREDGARQDDGAPPDGVAPREDGAPLNGVAWSNSRIPLQGLAIGIALLMLVAAAFEGRHPAEKTLRWTSAALFGPPLEAARLMSLMKPVMATNTPVLTSPTTAPWVANRSTLHVLGEFRLDPDALSRLLHEVEWAVLSTDQALDLHEFPMVRKETEASEGAATSPNDPPSPSWNEVLTGAGFEFTGTAYDTVVWRHPAPRH